MSHEKNANTNDSTTVDVDFFEIKFFKEGLIYTPTLYYKNSWDAYYAFLFAIKFCCKNKEDTITQRLQHSKEILNKELFKVAYIINTMSNKDNWGAFQIFLEFINNIANKKSDPILIIELLLKEVNLRISIIKQGFKGIENVEKELKTQKRCEINKGIQIIMNVIIREIINKEKSLYITTLNAYHFLERLKNLFFNI